MTTAERQLAETARGGLVGLAGSIVAAVMGFALTIVVARLLGPAQAGVFFVVVALFMILSETTELGADTALVRTSARLRALGRVDELRPVLVYAFVPVLAVSGPAAAALWMLAEPLAEMLADPAHREVATVFLRLAAPFLALSAARSVALAGTRGLGSVATFALVNNIMIPSLRPLLALAGMAFGLGAWWVMFAWSLPVGLGFLLAGVALWRLLVRAEAEPRERVPYEEGEPSAVREFWLFSGPRGVAAVIEILIIWLGVLMVGAMVSSHDAGIYATASRFITTGTLVVAASRIAIAPQIAALLAREERAQAEHLYGVATGWIVAGSWPIYLALACFGPFVLTMFGDGFDGGATPMAILAVSMLVVMAAGNVQTVLLMGGKSSWSLLNKCLALATTVVLTLLLVPRFGIVGAAVAWGATMLVDTVAAAVQVRTRLGLRLGAGPLAYPALWALFWFGALGVAVRWLAGPGAAAFAGYLLVACAGYGFTLWRGRARLHADVLLGAIKRRGT
ncbi:polysaccharide biosynthesis C-terminal domain-containing protein [Nonomuraea sp. NPDC059194]|uniref:oligosaccharide flippase family protein n=1 Tax=Nonomuraea sp. NPDC059194 TaxID=3346764 RepID=UPI0036B911DE